MGSAMHTAGLSPRETLGSPSVSIAQEHSTHKEHKGAVPSTYIAHPPLSLLCSETLTTGALLPDTNPQRRKLVLLK